MPTGLLALDALLPAPKAQLARRLVLAGSALSAAAFRKRGCALSKADLAALGGTDRDPLATRVVTHARATDGTQKLVVELTDGETVETVALPQHAACVSTQVGCAVGCRFCASGLAGLRRNLTVQEIVEQVAHARRVQRIDRVVFMGIGEPTHNLPAVLEAVRVLRDDACISARKLTLSTVGSVRAFASIAQAPAPPCIALSLHTADPDVRAALLPHAPREPLPELVAAADACGRAGGMPVQVQWTLLEGINDRDADVEKLAALLRGVRGYVNLIPWNRVDELPFASPPRERTVEIVRALKRRGILTTIRDSAGADAHAACGQLRRGR